MEEKEDHSKRPEDTNFKQQRLKAWQPLLTPAYVIGTFFIVGCVFIPIGGALLAASQSVVEIEHTYGPPCNDGTSVCQDFILTVPSKMAKPVYVYYKLTNFYQNHRRYVKSRSDEQLSGTDVGNVANCDPLQNNANGVPLYPCGLIASSMFNDVFSFQVNGSPAAPRETGIAWQSDIDRKFKDQGFVSGDSGAVNGYPGLTRNLTANGRPFIIAPNSGGIDNEHFIVWMRTAGLPTFKKLWAVFDRDFNAGDTITVSVQNNFPTASFNGEKAIVLSTTSWLGGKNDFLGVAYIVVGCVCIVLGAIFLIKHCVSPRPLGDMQYLSWPGASAAAAAPARAG